MVSLRCRRIHPTVAVLVGLVASAGIARATGSLYNGLVLDVRSAASPSTPGNVRVSIQVSGTTTYTSTGLGSWYSYDLPDGAVSKLWAATLIAALHNGGPSISAVRELVIRMGLRRSITSTRFR
jgi:hypothetical protein